EYADCCIIIQCARRVLWVSEHERVSSHRNSDAAAGSPVEESQRTEYPGESSDAGEWICDSANGDTEHIRDRSGFSRRICSELAAFRPTGSACSVADGCQF